MKWNASRRVVALLALIISGVVGSLIGIKVHNTVMTIVLAMLGAAVGMSIIILSDTWQAYRVLEWLRLGADGPEPMTRGLWGEMAHRIGRSLRLREQQIHHEHQRLVQFFEAIDASPNGVLLLDVNDQIDWFSSVAAEHFGLQPERDLRQRITNLVRVPVFVNYLQARDFSSSVRFLSPQGHRMLSVIVREYGEQQKLLLTQDITERIRSETMRKDFVANVSHEIRTPLTVLSGFIETLVNLPLNEAERKRVLSLMAQQTTRMQALVSDLLALAQLEGKPAPALNQWVSVAQLMARSELDASSLSAKRHQLIFKGAEAYPSVAQSYIAGSETELQSALANLVNNAIRYTPEGGVIEVAWVISPDGGGVFTVTDTGPGIEAEHLPRLAERFYRVDSSRSRDTGGTGLGLSIVKHVMQRHAGELDIQSQLGEGSCFSLIFPPARVRVEAEKEGKLAHPMNVHSSASDLAS